MSSGSTISIKCDGRSAISSLLTAQPATTKRSKPTVAATFKKISPASSSRNENGVSMIDNQSAKGLNVSYGANKKSVERMMRTLQTEVYPRFDKGPEKGGRKGINKDG